MNKQIAHKNKGKEFMKVLVVTALAIGVFSTAFLGINAFAFAAATSGVETVPLLVDTVGIPTEPGLPEDFQSPEMTVIADTSSPMRTNALSPQEAAEIGAQYIWEVFGESIDGTFVEMVYATWPASTRTAWVGFVWENDPATHAEPPIVDCHCCSVFDFAWEQELFSFSIDSVTGKRVNIGASLSDFANSDAFDWAAVVSSGVFDTVPDIDPTLREVALEFAQRHFNTTTVQDIQFDWASPLAFAQDESGNIFATDYMLVFSVTDNTGRVADVMISMETGQLLSIDTSHNDFIPGFQFVPSADAVG